MFAFYILSLVVLFVLALLAYAWLAYDRLLSGFARWFGKPVVSRPHEGDSWPRVCVIFAAYHEEAHIRDRLRNLLEGEYPADRLSIEVGVDGPGDRTGEIARELAAADPRIRVYEFPERRGKVAVLKDLVRMSADSILVFTDANTHFRADALKRLVAPLADARVGGVCGRLVLVRPGEEGRTETAAEHEEGFYWSWETTLKRNESRLDSCLGANGAIFAIRRELFWEEIPHNTVVDDFVIGMKVREQGGRMVYEPDAVAVEPLPENAAEWVRRVRIGSGDYQAMVFCRRCLLPRYGWFAWAFLSHKVLRWLTPHAAVVLAACGAFLCFSPLLWQVALGGFCLLLTLGALAGGLMIPWVFRSGPLGTFAQLCRHFVTMQAALLAGCIRYWRGGLKGYWVRTPRGGPSGGDGRWREHTPREGA